MQIEIDFDVFKEITLRRANEGVTPNDVLREVFGLEPKNSASTSDVSVGEPWMIKGVKFPHGTEFRATYKGKIYNGVVEDGALVVNSKRYPSPSAAAVAITGNAVNGWVFWECKFPGQTEWETIKSYRN